MTDLELQWLQRLALALEHILKNLQAIRLQLMADHVPSYQYDLSAFPRFDWESIGAVVLERDKCGATVVSWGGHDYLRRSPQNKFGEAKEFSRCTGKDENGENAEERLITFKRRDARLVEPLPDRVSKHLAVGA